MAECVTCGEEAGVFRESGRLRAYCANTCAPRLHSTPRPKIKGRLVACRGCGEAFALRWRGQVCCSRVCGRKRPAKPLHKCKRCGVEFKPQHNAPGNYCSRPCAILARTISGDGPMPRWSKVAFLSCVVCGIAFVARRHRAAKVCGEDCRKAQERALANAGNREKNQKSARTCPGCDVVFVPQYGDKRRRFCARACGASYHARRAKARRDARVIANGFEQFDPLEVLRRDGWRCQACGKGTPRRLRGSFVDDAPELDHIIPLSRGGAHTRANTQCLCRACNIAKADGEWRGVGQSQQPFAPAPVGILSLQRRELMIGGSF